MREYAQIVDGTIKNIAIFEDKATFQPEEGAFVDITDIVPKPGVGATFANGKFIANIKQKPVTQKPGKDLNLTALSQTNTGKALIVILKHLGLL